MENHFYSVYMENESLKWETFNTENEALDSLFPSEEKLILFR